MRFYELNLTENATAGSTSSGCVAIVPQPIGKKKPLGVGFNPDGDRGIYNDKNGSEKPILIKRMQ